MKTKNNKRAIKFRAWEIDTKKMIEWDKLWYLLAVLPKGAYKDQDEEATIPFFVMAANSSKYVVEQYIGLDDINGNEIYEGDIVSFQQKEGEKSAEIKFDDAGYILYSPIRTALPKLSAPQITRLKLKVIGNVYQNPELALTLGL